MPGPREQAIRERAYAIYEEEGHPDGKALDHWLRAEAEIVSADKYAGERGSADVLQKLLAAWEPCHALSDLPENPVKLWGEGGYGVWLAATWGPPVPYPQADHENGHNYGYRRVKGDLSSICQIPEVEGWPELCQILRVINAFDSPIESVGCEKGYSSPKDTNAPPVMLGSYIDVIFTDLALNERPQNFLALVSRLIPAIQDCEKWWGNVSFVLQRLKLLPGVTTPWGLMFQINNYGRSEAEARRFWTESLRRLANIISNLSPDFDARGAHLS
jgi:hypothetical protein